MKRFHNETYLQGDSPCMDCGSKDNLFWTTHNVFWNSVMEDVEGSGILCVYCFARRSEEKYKVRGWYFTPQFKWEEKN
jgi:hypothetical protein